MWNMRRSVSSLLATSEHLEDEADMTEEQRKFAALFGGALREFSFAGHHWLKGRDLEVAVRNSLIAMRFRNPELPLMVQEAIKSYHA